MNRTLKDILGLSLALWISFFISNLTNPDADKGPITGGFIGLAYCVGRRTEQEARKTPKVRKPQQPRPPIKYGGKQ
jgi:hypothetical protein